MVQLVFRNVPDFIQQMRDNNARLLINVAPDGVGHVIGELDWFLRARLAGERPAGETAVILSADHQGRLETMRRLFGPLLAEVWGVGDYPGFLARIIAHAAPELTLDFGFSSYKIAPPAGAQLAGQWRLRDMLYEDPAPGTWLTAGHDEWYRLRAATDGRFPFLDCVTCSDDLENFIGARGGKVAVLQIKTEISSGAALLTTPESMEPALALLRDEGFTIAFAGREKMPDSWRRFGVVDYASSPLASFENDFRLFRRADFGVVGASGISQFLEVFDKPYVYLNTALTLCPPFSRRAVYNPAIFRRVSDDRFLSFAEANAIPRRTLWNNRDMTYVHATPDQVVAAIREALDRAAQPDRPPTPLQARYKSLGTPGSFSYARSVVCDDFLRAWEHLLPA